MDAFLIQIKATTGSLVVIMLLLALKGKTNVCLNILRLQFQSPPSENWNNGEGGKFKKRGLSFK